jgi:hypothetical protein
MESETLCEWKHLAASWKLEISRAQTPEDKAKLIVLRESARGTKHGALQTMLNPPDIIRTENTNQASTQTQMDNWAHLQNQRPIPL